MLGQRRDHAARAGRRAWSTAVAKVQPLWALLRVQDRARYMRRMAQAVIDDFDELPAGARARAGPPARGDRGARAAGRDRRADVDRRGRRRRARRAPCGHQPLAGARQARAHRLRAVRRGRRDRRRQRAVRAAARADRGSAAGGQRRRLQARRAAPAWRASGSRACWPARACRRGSCGSCTAAPTSASRSPSRRSSKILFTGSPAVGRVVARACVSREKEVTVELGGKDAMLVLADAHLPRAVAGALWAGLRRRRAGARLDRARVRRARGLRALPRGARAAARGR